MATNRQLARARHVNVGERDCSYLGLQIRNMVGQYCPLALKAANQLDVLVALGGILLAGLQDACRLGRPPTGHDYVC
jgi:hypothetical protein